MNPHYDTADLVGVIQTIRPAPTFFLNRYFRRDPLLSVHEHIVFDEVLEGLPIMAPFVSPIVQAKAQKRSGFQAKTFTPAYVKPKHFIKPGDFLTRSPGEDLLGSMSPEERMDREIIRLLAVQRRQIEARWEWMAARATIDGKVVVTGEDYPEVEVDFGRDADNDIIVSGAGNLWSNEDADIGSMLEDWSDQLLEMTGFAGTDVVMAPEIWKHFRKNKVVLRDAELRRGIQAVPNLQPRVADQNARFVGQWGEFSLYVYAGRFKDQDGTVSRALAATDIIMTAAPSEIDGTGGVEGIRAFGAIQDKKARLWPLDIFPKTWEEEDPSGEQLMSQSAPLMIPGRPNAVIKAKVV
ncbi:MAG: major capsid protein [Mesorhizobium sp.]|nr:major capsid protein [Mesorhizobium sp.]